MFAIRQMIDDPQDFIPVPAELRHRPTEVIFIALDSAPEVATVALAGGGQDKPSERAAAAITAFRGSGPKGTTADLLNDRAADRRREG
jgi:hypothetical protein